MNSKDEAAFKKFAKELSILHYAMTFGAFMMCLVIYYFLMGDANYNFPEMSDIFLYICPAVACGGIFLGNFLFKKNIEEARNQQNFEDKLMTYRVGAVRKFALLEGPAIICALGGMQSQNLLYLTLAILLITLMLLQHKSESIVREDLGLD